MPFCFTQALADLKARNQELSHREDLIKVLTQDRDRALATLKQHGIKINHKVDVSMTTNMNFVK